MPRHDLIIVPYFIPGSNFNLLAKILSEYALEHPQGLEPNTIKFVSPGLMT
jgi:hypothetical protein